MATNLSSFSALIAALLLSASSAAAQALLPPASPPELVPSYKSVFTPEESRLAAQYENWYTINPESVRITQEASYEGVSLVKLSEQPPKDLSSVLVSIEKIVNIASKIWDIINDNKPVVNIDTKYATAYPEGVTSAAQLASWSRPVTYVYGFYAENLYGVTTIDVKYKVTYTYNGNYKGKGKFLTAVSVIPEKTQVSWGYRFHMAANVPDSTVANVGSHEDPVAAMQLKLNWTMATALKQFDGTSVYYVEGNGYFKEIASPWKKDAATGTVYPFRNMI